MAAKNVSVGLASTVVWTGVPKNQCTSAIVTNEGANDIWLCLDGDAVDAKGILVAASGGQVTIPADLACFACNGITTIGATLLAVERRTF